MAILFFFFFFQQSDNVFDVLISLLLESIIWDIIQMHNLNGTLCLQFLHYTFGLNKHNV